jgi:hypothetical protein
MFLLRVIEMKRTLTKSIKIVTINLLLLVLLLETASIALYFHHTRKFFYTANKSEVGTNTMLSNNELFDDGGPATLNRILHPYLGFVYDEHARIRLQFSDVEYAPNNLGIFSPYDYPFKKTSSDQFIVGIFGGSVAMYYGFYELEHHVLVSALKRLPYFKNKQIIVLPFAAGSYKQPQQLLELNYFTSLGQDFDLVINIDGFNETSLAYLNNKSGLDPSMPNIEMFGPLVRLANRNFSSDQLNLSLQILQLKEELRDTRTSLLKCRIATCYTLRWTQLRYFLSQYQKKSEAFNRLARNENARGSLVYVDKRDQPLDDAAVLAEISGVWAKSELSMNELLTAKRIPYFAVVQPNQYYSTGRKFTDAEKKILNCSTIYTEGVIKGYPALIAQLDDLKKSGVKVISAVNAFDKVEDSVYVDACCHYNQAGNDVFAKFVAEQIVSSLQTQPGAR